MEFSSKRGASCLTLTMAKAEAFCVLSFHFQG